MSKLAFRAPPQDDVVFAFSSGFWFLVSGFTSSPQPLVRDILDTMARYQVEEYVRWEDIDAAGIINYQAYLRFFGLAEAELFRSAGLSYRYLFDVLHLWLPRVRVECDFRVPVTLDELLVVDAFFGRIGTRSIHIHFEVRRKLDPETIVATGKYVLVSVRQGEFTAVPVPDEVRDRIAPFVEQIPM
jgi:YbgC/YbaW family acyl-CoA thioester hydrolase